MTAHSPAVPEERLPRTIGLWSAAAILVGTTIGSGIFRAPSEVAHAVTSPIPMLLVWVFGGLVTLTGALTIAELAAALPRSGGIFAYIHEAWGPLPAFVYGWAELTVIRASAVGGIASVFARYLGILYNYVEHGQVVRLAGATEGYVAAVTILAIALLNYLGVSYASALQNVTTILKYGALVGLAALAFGAGHGDAAHFTATGGAVTSAAFLTALVPVMWTYDGWSNLSFIGGEVKNPGRALPRALILGTSAIVVIYLLMNVAYLYLLPVAGIAGADGVASTAAQQIPLLGAAGAAVVAGIVMVSCFGSVNGSLLTGPRVFFALSDRGLFFPVIARVSPRFKTPSVAIWLSATLGVAYVLQKDFAQLAESFIIGVWPFYALAVAGVFILRRRQPDLPRPYRTLGYPVTPALFLLASLGMVVNSLLPHLDANGALVSHAEQNMITFGIILTGVPVYFAWQWWKSKN